MLYLPGNKEAKDTIKKLSDENNKKIKVQFLNSRAEVNSKRKNKGKDRLFHGKFVRANVTIIDGNIEKIIGELRKSNIVVGPVDDLPTKTLSKITLRSHSWAPFPRDIELINKIKEVTYISIPEKNLFVVYGKNENVQEQVLEILQITKAANSRYQTFFADDQSPWSQVNIKGNESIINTKYAQHSYISENTLLVSGFDTPTSATFIQRLLDNTTPATTTYAHSITNSTPNVDGEIGCRFLNSPNTSLRNDFTLEITANANTINLLKTNGETLKSISKHKYHIQTHCHQELIFHSQVRVYNQYDDEFEEWPDEEQDDKKNGYTTILSKSNNNKIHNNNEQKKKKSKVVSNNNGYDTLDDSEVDDDTVEIFERKVEEGDFETTQDTLIDNFLTRYLTCKPTREFRSKLKGLMVRITAAIYPSYHIKKTLPVHYERKTRTTSGVGGMIISYLSGLAPDKYHQILPILKSFLAGKTITLAVLRSQLNDNQTHTGKPSSSKNNKKQKRVVTAYFDKEQKKTKTTAAEPTSTNAPPSNTLNPSPPNPASGMDTTGMQIEEKGEALPTTSKNAKEPTENSTVENPNPSPSSGGGTGGGPQPPVPPDDPPGKSATGDSSQ